MKKRLIHVGKGVFWFIVGATIGLFFSVSFLFIFFEKVYGSKVYPGIHVASVSMGGKTADQVRSYFVRKNDAIASTPITFVYQNTIATYSAGQIGFGYDANLLSDQAYISGRSDYFLSNVSLIVRSYISGMNLAGAYTFNQQTLQADLASMSAIIKKDPVDAQFTLADQKVTAFRLSQDGQDIDWDNLTNTLNQELIPRVINGDASPVNIVVPIKVIHPQVTTGAANNLGITQLIGEGESLFFDSIPNRVKNIVLASSRLNGTLIPPHQTFSFAKTIGEISAATGYYQAYVISGHATVLGDGGGVCQVSTTLFRAALNAGLPIVERHPHDYRVGYYEEDGPPGIDAAVNVPEVDLKFTNDTNNWILVQSSVDTTNMRLVFDLYGTSDGRKVTMTTPVVSNIVPAPPPLYIDDPTLPKGVVQQTDFAANGAHVQFSRTVTRGGQILDQDTFVSDYQPWQAVYHRGTAG